LRNILAREGWFRQRRAPTPLAVALAVSPAMLSWIRRWRERSRGRRLLAAMSERELQDIGISRGDIAHRIAEDIGK